MIPKNTFFFLIFFASFFSVTQAQLPSRELTLKEGLSSNFIISSAQDRKGFLWFATESGLNRFDGSSMKVYKKEHPNSSINANELNKVFADPTEDKVWIATQREGLNMFDCNTLSFSSFKHDPKNPKSIITNDITDITGASNGNIWLASYHRGIEYYDKKQGIFKHFNTSTIKGMHNDNTWCVREFLGKYLLIGHVNQGLSVLDLQTHHLVNYKEQADKKGLPGNQVLAICIDKNNNIWIGTNNGLTLFDIHTGKFQPVYSSNKTLATEKIFAITQLKDGKIWVGTEGRGIQELAFNNNALRRPDSIILKEIFLNNKQQALGPSTVRTILQDSFANIWVGYYGQGLINIPNKSPRFHTIQYSDIPNQKNALSNGIAWGITCDNDNKLWIGTDGGGVNLFQQGERKHTFTKSNSALRDNAILCATTSSNGNIWIGTFKGGITVFNPLTLHAQSLGSTGLDADVRCLFENTDKTMWVGGGNGISIYNEQLQLIQQINQHNTKLPSDLVRAIAKDALGNIWVGFFGKGLAIFNKDWKLIKQFETYSGFPSNTVHQIFRDHKERMWVATGEGLVEFYSSIKFNVYNEKNGLANGHIRAITQDTDNNIWVSTLSGISKLSANNKQILNFGKEFGVPLADFMSGGVCWDKQGNVFFTSADGVCFFNPKKIPNYATSPKVSITEIRVYNDNKILGDYSDIPVTPTIQLNHDQNTFRISFNSMDYTLNPLLEYSYMLKGLNDTWYYMNNENAITFRNIPPGRYDLTIRTRMKNQHWEENTTNLVISIRHPWWWGVWAKTIYGLAVIVIGLIVLRFYKRKLELEHSLKWEKLQHQQEHDLHEERVRFFTNVTHELRTPIMLILGPLEDMLHQAGSDKSPFFNKITIIHKSASRLLTVVNRLLDFHKTESQEKQLHLEQGNIIQTIQDIGHKFAALNSNPNIVFNIQIQHNHPVQYFDNEAIISILENLLSNAFKYTNSGNITLRITETNIKDVAYTLIAVEDTGKGIPAHAQEAIFDRYYQVKEDRKVAGTGIGLALVKNLITLHGGSISVQSTVGKGSIFSILLPMDKTSAHAVPLLQTIAPSRPPLVNEEEQTKDSVLIIDDNPEIVQYLSEHLSDEYTVLTASNGQEGRSTAFETIPDIIVSDVMMPEINGFDLCKELKTDIRTSHIPFILITAKVSPDDRLLGYSVGVDSYLTKPTSASLLKSRIKNLFQNRKKITANIGKEIPTNGTHTEPIVELSTLDNSLIKRIRSIIEEHIHSENLDVQFIAEKMDMSHSTLYRKIKSMLGISANELIRKVRVQYAARLLSEGNHTISEISYLVGLNSVAYFRQCFKEEFEMTPSEFLKKNKTSRS